MKLKIGVTAIIVMAYPFMILSCVQKTGVAAVKYEYIVQSLEKNIEEEASGKKPPIAWGGSWIKHWKECYAGMRKENPGDAEKIIGSLERTRKQKGLNPID